MADVTFTGSFSVTLFNAHADEEVPDTDDEVVDGVAQLQGAQAGAAGAAVSSNESSNALDVTISGASVTGTGGDLVPPIEFPLPHNIIGGVMSGASNRLFDTDSQTYTLGRVMHWCMPQLKNMVLASTRPDQIQDYIDLKADNPFFSAGFHFSPFLTTRGFREVTKEWRRYLYDYLQTQHRQQVLVHYNANNWASELNSCETPSSGFAQTLVAINPNHTPIGDSAEDLDSGLREWMSDSWTDFICGTTLSTLPITAGDVSDFMYICTDNTAITKLGSNDSVHPTHDNSAATGTVSHVTYRTEDEKTTHAKTVRLSSTLPSAITSLDEPAIMFFPASGSTKFIAYRIESVSGTTVTLKNLPKLASDTQTAIPAVGWRYAINDNTKSMWKREADWDKDGNAEGTHDGAAIWNPKMIAVHDLVNTKVKAATGHDTMRGWNGIGAGFGAKEGAGWRTPHDQSESQDVGLMENASSAHWHWKIDSSSQNYEIYRTAANHYDPKTHQKALHFAATYIRSPSNFAKPHARGAFVEFMVWGEGETNKTWEVEKKNAIDAHAARYHLACIIPVQNVNFSIQVKDSLTTLYTLTEQFLDLETGGVEPQDFGTYSEGKGETSSTERLQHDFTFRTPDAGLRIYMYRCGNFLVCVNMCDMPSEYRSSRYYRPPSHSSPLAARPDHDQIKPADWAALETKGILASDEYLRKIDATTYVNDLATAYLQSQAPTIWGPDNPKGSFSYGPKQATPFDDIATPLSELDLIMHDDDWNDGSDVSRDEILNLPPYTAYFLEIYKLTDE